MKGIFLFTSGLILGILIGINIKPPSARSAIMCSEDSFPSIEYCKKDFDGIIHLLPLSCMPETTIEMLMNRVGQKYKIPIYRFPIDENRFEAGFDTRIETFISVLRRKKKCILG